MSAAVMDAGIEVPSLANRIVSNEMHEPAEGCDDSAEQRVGGWGEAWRGAVFPYQSRCAAAYDEDEQCDEAALCDDNGLCDEAELCDEDIADDDIGSAAWKFLNLLAFAAQVNPLSRSRGIPLRGGGKTPPTKAQKVKQKANSKRATPNKKSEAELEKLDKIGRMYMSSLKGQKQEIAGENDLNGLQIRRHIQARAKATGGKAEPLSVFDYILGTLRAKRSSKKP